MNILSIIAFVCVFGGIYYGSLGYDSIANGLVYFGLLISTIDITLWLVKNYSR